MNIQVRRAVDTEQPAILAVAMAAFGAEQGQEIAELISDLLVDPTAQPLLSLVATADERVVGHVLFTNVRLASAQRTVAAAILAPLAVDPAYQSQGIGGRLITEGLTQLKAAGVELAFVLGHPGYYPRYGFAPAEIQGFTAPYPIPPEHAEAWMVQELQPGVIGHVRGQVQCADALSDPEHW